MQANLSIFQGMSDSTIVNEVLPKSSSFSESFVFWQSWCLTIDLQTSPCVMRARCEVILTAILVSLAHATLTRASKMPNDSPFGGLKSGSKMSVVSSL